MREGGVGGDECKGRNPTLSVRDSILFHPAGVKRIKKEERWLSLRKGQGKGYREGESSVNVLCNGLKREEKGEGELGL